MGEACNWHAPGQCAECRPDTGIEITIRWPNPWREFLRRIRIGGALPVSLLCLGDTIRVEMAVPDVNTGEPLVITRDLDTPPWTSESRALQWVREQVVWFYRHEADEQIRLDGERCFELEHEHAP